jgi:hypothetical protein
MRDALFNVCIRCQRRLHIVCASLMILRLSMISSSSHIAEIPRLLIVTVVNVDAKVVGIIITYAAATAGQESMSKRAHFNPRGLPRPDVTHSL